MVDRARIGRRWRLKLGSLFVAVAALAVVFGVIRSTMAPDWAATEALKRTGRSPLLSQVRARSAAKVGPDRWQVRYDDAARKRELVVTITDEDVKKASFPTW